MILGSGIDTFLGYRSETTTGSALRRHRLDAPRFAENRGQ
jgi:hypothetical protein